MTYRLMFKKLFFVLPASILLFYSLWLKPMKLVNLILLVLALMMYICEGIVLLSSHWRKQK